mmetsp:Transcript_31035/g.72549  ORF Transcript_31035/g.72549 Transcript_31035/m.72549 type:complete len:178 (-) Transcript_31035:112-645(-)|eukprot:CAMPEP_0180139268 /NCGR_PEP_ID=MMETSP0986-20121125/13426_1 /TAXON_ID=697907 /ORGANISM="non described non described, Strain CCMP2293" /LENGTH=177 /DNA_ID=CAMNT_0022081327 /DNA_START=53 /DNA_END=586 /DNA_ORIENTATION=+
MAPPDMAQWVTPELPAEIRNCGDDLEMRPLRSSDWEKGYIQLLAQLTTAPLMPRAEFDAILRRMRDSKCYYTVVVEHLPTKKIVAAATLLVEFKLIRGGHLGGHVEDVVVDTAMRGRSLGIKIILALKSVAKDLGCYKLILDCSQDNVKFYERCGMKLKEVQMAVYFPENQDRRPKL